jgi:hypothetical protein
MKSVRDKENAHGDMRACLGNRTVFLRSTENILIIGSGMSGIRFHKIWVQQCRATRGIKRRFGVKSALDYLIGEKLMNFADAAQGHPEFAAELPRFQAAVWNIFNPYELAGYLSSLKPSKRKKLQELLYVDGVSTFTRAR